MSIVMAQNFSMDRQSKIRAFGRTGRNNDKILLERFSDISLEDHVSNPSITLSSFEDDGSVTDQDSSMEVDARASAQNTSLSVPTVNISNEAKRPPL